MGIISCSNSGKNLKELTSDRTLAAVHFGGRYRMIDFIMSNMVNSGIKNVGLFIRHKSRSLLDHLRSGKDWDLHRNKDGLFILPTDFSSSRSARQRGNVEDFYSHMDYLLNSSQEYVLISGSAIVCNIDFNDAFNYHMANNNDITVLYKEETVFTDDYSRCVMLEVQQDRRITDMQVNPINSRLNKVSMEMYILKKALLIDIMNTCIAHGNCDLVKDGFIRNIDRLRIFAYPYEGYLARINSIANFYRHSMNLLNRDIWQQLFLNNQPIYTKVKNEVPTKFLEGSSVKSSIIASGCVIEGNVENSILFRGVRVKKGAYLKNCIVLPKGVVSERAYIENVIFDKEVTISCGKTLKGDTNVPMYIDKGKII